MYVVNRTKRPRKAKNALINQISRKASKVAKNLESVFAENLFLLNSHLYINNNTKELKRVNATKLHHLFINLYVFYKYKK